MALAADTQALLESGALIRERVFPFRRVLLLALSLAPLSGKGVFCEWCSDAGADPLRVRAYPEVGPHHPQCFIDAFILMGDAQRELHLAPPDQERRQS